MGAKLELGRIVVHVVSYMSLIVVFVGVCGGVWVCVGVRGGV